MIDEIPDQPPAKTPFEQMAETWPRVGANSAALPPSPAPVRTARIRCRDTVRALGFTFGKGKVVAGVPLPHAEWLAKEGKAEILETL